MRTGRGDARMNQGLDIEARLRAALAPVEPPEELALRMEARLGEIVELAADELESWELSAMRDPRNWPRAAVRPAAAVVVGTGAAAGLVVLRTRRRRHKRRAPAPTAPGPLEPPPRGPGGGEPRGLLGAGPRPRRRAGPLPR